MDSIESIIEEQAKQYMGEQGPELLQEGARLERQYNALMRQATAEQGLAEATRVHNAAIESAIQALQGYLDQARKEQS